MKANVTNIFEISLPVKYIYGYIKIIENAMLLLLVEVYVHLWERERQTVCRQLFVNPLVNIEKYSPVKFAASPCAA